MKLYFSFPVSGNMFVVLCKLSNDINPQYFVSPSSAIDKTEFSTNQSSSLSVSMAFFTDLDTVLSSINFVT